MGKGHLINKINTLSEKILKEFRDRFGYGHENYPDHLEQFLLDAMKRTREDVVEEVENYLGTEHEGNITTHKIKDCEEGMNMLLGFLDKLKSQDKENE